MSVSARVIADSVSKDFGNRVTTMVVTMHRFVLAEFNTHRVFSRNSASSRAIPVEAQLRRAMADPAWPVLYPCEQPGMSGGETLTGHDLNDAFAVLNDIKQFTTQRIGEYLAAHPEKDHRLHKSLLNRPLEWFGWHTVVVTSTEWENFFGLRCHPAAQPEMRAAADMMRQAYERSTPVEVCIGEWHAPFAEYDNHDPAGLGLEGLLKQSAARCAWVSTLKHGEHHTWEDVERIYETLTRGLAEGEPVHASPFEHQCTPSDPRDTSVHLGNLVGWRQLRHMIESKETPWE